MARRWKGGMSGERYLGNKNDKQVHDLEHETPECRIDEIMHAEYEIAFRTIGDAHDQGYTDCPYCKVEDEGACKI